MLKYNLDKVGNLSMLRIWYLSFMALSKPKVLKSLQHMFQN